MLRVLPFDIVARAIRHRADMLISLDGRQSNLSNAAQLPARAPGEIALPIFGGLAKAIESAADKSS